jgi:hypothetical protein
MLPPTRQGEVMRRNIVEVREMSNLAFIRLLVGMACFCGVATQSFAVDEVVQPRVPNFFVG